MQALRLARPRVSLRSIQGVRSIAAAANASHATPAAGTSGSSAIPLSNVEAQWEQLSPEEQLTVHQQLEELQKKDWKALSIEEKKAAYYVAFGPHGPRTPTHKPGSTLKIFSAVAAAVGVTAALYFSIRSTAPPPPKTINKEWEEAMNQRAIEQKMDPISGIGAADYKGPGFVQHK
ncbi:cytochrome c oxidase subunit IV [Abortiporus biennis]|nr:cytochrome c oxidase subunit IV [Abortiporus biennis]